VGSFDYHPVLRIKPIFVDSISLSGDVIVTELLDSPTKVKSTAE
jgi:hypothetical protein